MAPDTSLSSPIANTLHRLRDHIASIPKQLVVLPESALVQKKPGKWSQKEILGHLIDSALNNLKRFTDAQFADGFYEIQGYQQDDLVIINRYQALPLRHLITLWSSLNTQILYVLEGATSETLAQPVRFASSGVPDRTLDWLINDYVDHLKTLL